ncbi:allantoicase [Vibrio coralliilyticus]|uniref:Probable allantoicase n=1 Tax=Vibrio coralliilyticus TaxID=190893 RepID=A0A2A2MXF7_9VIBR|nr:allantoicase [Vibrio coralliilyticus]KJY70027.1 allantoicase [Vibrio coralliilyticus]NOI74364.1 allantoicase [Vibrio coralliilyticus]NRF29851.1 allantoicase [Vibrio coralliilyticus]NRF51341.1 allantoicase [Vibrio coralliilyticus]NRG04172.1 allantoicase [Vibrio coralliilyticus]
MSLDFEQYINLADDKLGAQAIYATDDFFADKSRLLRREAPEWKEGVYDDNGKWMDGWESRRKRGEGYDYCVIRLGLAGTIAGVDIDTSFFTGNFPPSASIDACYSPDGDPTDATEWQEILPSMSLQGDHHHLEQIESGEVFTHLRLNIYPDGGVARLRVYGRPSVDWDRIDAQQKVDLAAVENGGRALACSDEHYGNKSNILGPGRGENMGDGWETARRRTPGNDWVIVALGHAGNIDRVVVDTAHFKGNFPDSCSIQAAYVKGGTDDQVATQSLFWRELLPAQKLKAHDIHEFVSEVNELGAVTHVRLNIFPDGGISRLRLFGTKAE